MGDNFFLTDCYGYEIVESEKDRSLLLSLFDFRICIISLHIFQASIPCRFHLFSFSSSSWAIDLEMHNSLAAI